MSCALSFVSPIGLVCAVEDALPFNAETSQSELADYAQILRVGLLRPVFSPAAGLHLRLLAVAFGISIFTAVAFWVVLLQKHFTGAKALRWMLPVDCGSWGTAHLPEPRLAWTIPMAVASALLLASCMDQQDGHDPLDPIALNGLAVLLFCMAAWLQFPGAVYQSFRLRFGRATFWVNISIWGTASIMFASLNGKLDKVTTAWHRAYRDGIGLHDALLDGNSLWASTYAQGYTSYVHEIETLNRSSEAAAEKIDVFVYTALAWLALITLVYLPVAIIGLVRPRSRPPTPGLGLDFGTQQQGLQRSLALLSPAPKPPTIFEEVEEDESAQLPSYTRQARLRLAMHLAFSLFYGAAVATCLLHSLLGVDHGAEEGPINWIWQSTIVPGWTHAIGTLTVNAYLLVTTLAEKADAPPLILASPQKRQLEKTPRTAFEVSTPSRQQMRNEMQRTPSFARTTPRRRNLSRELQMMQVI